MPISNKMGQSSKTVQANYYFFGINGIYYVKFRDPISDKELGFIERKDAIAFRDDLIKPLVIP
jgi:hypothetical protein